MADRIPLIVDSSSQRIKELPSGDNLDLTGNNISAVRNILPEADSTYNLGSSSYSWNNLYAVDATFTGQLSSEIFATGSEGDVRFYDADSSNFVAFQAPATVSSNVTWTLPDADAGTSGYALVSDGAGTLSWAAAGATISQDEATNTNFNLYFASTTSGALTSVKYDTGVHYNPSTGTLTSSVVDVTTLNIDTTEVISSSEELTTTTANQTIDTFSASSYRTAKYIIQGISGGNVHATEVLITHDDWDVYTSQYATIYSLSSLFTVSASISSGNVVVTVTPANTDTTIDFVRVSLIARTLTSTSGDLQSQSGTEDLSSGSGTEDLN